MIGGGGGGGGAFLSFSSPLAPPSRLHPDLNPSRFRRSLLKYKLCAKVSSSRIIYGKRYGAVDDSVTRR